jgi:hypothetical protein
MTVSLEHRKRVLAFQEAILLKDMTRMEFNAALQRRGWRKVLVWIDIGHGHSIGLVMRKGSRGYKINLRASLAHAIQQSEKYERERAEAIAATHAAIASATGVPAP